MASRSSWLALMQREQCRRSPARCLSRLDLPLGATESDLIDIVTTLQGDTFPKHDSSSREAGEAIAVRRNRWTLEGATRSSSDRGSGGSLLPPIPLTCPGPPSSMPHGMRRTDSLHFYELRVPWATRHLSLLPMGRRARSCPWRPKRACTRSRQVLKGGEIDPFPRLPRDPPTIFGRSCR